MINKLSEALYGESDISTAEMEAWFDVPDTVMLVAELDGRIGGYADLVDQALEHKRFWIDLRVPPGADESIGTMLLEAMEARAADDAEPEATVRVSVLSADDDGRRLVEGRDYELYRHAFTMRIDFDGVLPEPVWPDGISVRTFAAGQDDEAVYHAQTDAFADHFEHAAWPYENWRAWAFTDTFDPSLWWLAEEGDEIAGICLCRSEGGAGPEVGWVNVLGVRPPWRRRGLGRALLLQSFAEFRARGKRGAGLGVDGLNTTGAVRLYEQAGMHVVRQFDQYKKPLPA